MFVLHDDDRSLYSAAQATKPSTLEPHYNTDLGTHSEISFIIIIIL